MSAVLSRFPSTGVVLAQHGPLFKVQPGQFYPVYPELTVKEWADAHGTLFEPLLKRLNAQAEGDEMAREEAPSAPPRDTRHLVRWARTTIGYTGSYAERDDVEIEPMSVVEEQERGPE